MLFLILGALTSLVKCRQEFPSRALCGVVQRTKTMLQLKLKEPYDKVFVFLGLENPSTGVTCTLDAKIDTGAVVTVVPMSLVSDLGLEVFEHVTLRTADGSPMPACVCMCNVILSDEDEIEMPIYVCNTRANIALIGMDILQKCNYSQWHEFADDGHAIHFDVEVLDID